MNKLRLFISWISTRMKDTTFEHYAEHLLALTWEQYNDFRQEDMIRLTSGPTSSPPEPTTPMITFTGQTKGSATSQSQVVLKNFKKGIKRDASAYPIFKNDLYYGTFQRFFLATIKAQGLLDGPCISFKLLDQFSSFVCLKRSNQNRIHKRLFFSEELLVILITIIRIKILISNIILPHIVECCTT